MTWTVQTDNKVKGRGYRPRDIRSSFLSHSTSASCTRTRAVRYYATYDETRDHRHRHGHRHSTKLSPPPLVYHASRMVSAPCHCPWLPRLPPHQTHSMTVSILLSYEKTHRDYPSLQPLVGGGSTQLGDLSKNLRPSANLRSFPELSTGIGQDSTHADTWLRSNSSGSGLQEVHRHHSQRGGPRERPRERSRDRYIYIYIYIYLYLFLYLYVYISINV